MTHTKRPCGSKWPCTHRSAILLLVPVIKDAIARLYIGSLAGTSFIVRAIFSHTTTVGSGRVYNNGWGIAPWLLRNVRPRPINIGTFYM